MNILLLGLCLFVTSIGAVLLAHDVPSNSQQKHKKFLIKRSSWSAPALPRLKINKDILSTT